MVRRKVGRKKHGGAVKAMWYGTARRLAVEEELTLMEISKKLGVYYSTLRRWSTKGNWKKHREEFRETSASAVMKAKMILLDIIKRMDIAREAGEPVSSSEVDQMAKVAKTIEKLEAIITPRRAFVIFGLRFAIWCKEMYPDDEDFLARLSDAVQGFGNVILETDGRA